MLGECAVDSFRCHDFSMIIILDCCTVRVSKPILEQPVQGIYRLMFFINLKFQKGKKKIIY